MDCLEAQRIVSEKLDRAEIDGLMLESAKEHCRTCPDCGGYVRALLAVSKTTPQPPDELHDRIMAAVRRASVAAVADPVASLHTETSQETLPQTRTLGVALQRLKRAFNDPRNERTIIAWTVAASVVIMVSSIGTIMGVRMILAPSPVPTFVAQSSSPGRVDSAVPRESKSEPESSSAGVTDQGAASVAGVSLITVSGTVYRAAGLAAGVDSATLLPAGTTVTALDGQNQPRSRDVTKLSDPARVYLTDDAGALLGFDRVSRTYQGRVYALTSSEILSYGQWPALPNSVERPQSVDGSPAYRKLGTDSLGIPVYGLHGSTSQGILIAPGSSSSDPAAGNPDWTLWTPVAQ